MSHVLRIRPAAETDVDDAALYIAQDNLPAALRFYDAVDRTFRLIRETPNRWPRCEFDHPQLADVRKRAVDGFKNYLVFYSVRGRNVDVIRVLHGARDIPSVLADDFAEP